MQIIRTSGSGVESLSAIELSAKQCAALAHPLSARIITAIRDEPKYPKQLAKELRVHEQTIYYIIRKLQDASIIHVVRTQHLQGTVAKFFAPTSDAFVVPIRPFRSSGKLVERSSSLLAPFIDGGKLNAKIVVGSPDPHGPLKARSRDGYFGMDLALFLGTFLHTVDTSAVVLDTEMHDADLAKHHLIVVGGPIVNRVAGLIGSKLPIFFDDEKKGFFSKVSGKLYVHDEVGVIVKAKSPFNKDKMVLFIAGIRNSGTKAAILAFLQRFSELEKGNMNDMKIASHVVEGVDLDSDGQVDSVEMLE